MGTIEPMQRFRLRWRYLYPGDPLFHDEYRPSQGIAELPPYRLRIADCGDGDWELCVVAEGKVMASGRFPTSRDAAAAAEAWATRTR